jgi:hypothetical protein
MTFSFAGVIRNIFSFEQEQREFSLTFALNNQSQVLSSFIDREVAQRAGLSEKISQGFLIRNLG